MCTLPSVVVNDVTFNVQDKELVVDIKNAQRELSPLGALIEKELSPEKLVLVDVESFIHRTHPSCVCPKALNEICEILLMSIPFFTLYSKAALS